MTDDHLRHILLFLFHEGHSEREATKRICDVYGIESMNKSTCHFWFARFRTGDTTLEDKPRSERPCTFDENRLRTMVEENDKLTIRELAEILDSTFGSIQRHLHAIGKANKHGVWVPHRLSEANKNKRLEICEFLLNRQEQEPFLNRIVTGDEKWVLHANIRRRRSWVDRGAAASPTARAGLHPRKVLLCVWWDSEGIIHHELLPRNQTITAAVYAQQLERVNQALQEKRPGKQNIILLHDNARPHVAAPVKNKIAQLGWEVLPHPPYSPDLAPSDFHLFRSMQHFLAGKEYATEEAILTDLQIYFDSKPIRFFVKGIGRLPERWQNVVDVEGDYFVE